MIDLHMHSIFSDGSYTPEELVQTAEKMGVQAIALTDHDTVKGVDRVMAAGAQSTVETIPGVEISADYSPGTMHILGYCMDWHDRALEEHLAWIRNGRESRNQEIFHNLLKLGVHITWAGVCKYAGDDVVGRPHFAQAMVAAGYVKTTKEAFENFLGQGRPAYASRRRLKPEACIELIRQAGGLAVLAHPCTLQISGMKLRQLVKQLAKAGLDGLEVIYPEHTPQMQRRYRSLADSLGLVLTGGTDFHGAITPDITIGRGFGSLKVPNECLNNIKERIERLH